MNQFSSEILNNTFFCRNFLVKMQESQELFPGLGSGIIDFKLTVQCTNQIDFQYFNMKLFTYGLGSRVWQTKKCPDLWKMSKHGLSWNYFNARWKYEIKIVIIIIYLISFLWFFFIFWGGGYWALEHLNHNPLKCQNMLGFWFVLLRAWKEQVQPKACLYLRRRQG